MINTKQSIDYAKKRGVTSELMRRRFAYFVELREQGVDKRTAKKLSDRLVIVSRRNA